VPAARVVPAVTVGSVAPLVLVRAVPRLERPATVATAQLVASVVTAVMVVTAMTPRASVTVVPVVPAVPAELGVPVVPAVLVGRAAVLVPYPEPMPMVVPAVTVAMQVKPVTVRTVQIAATAPLARVTGRRVRPVVPVVQAATGEPPVSAAFPVVPARRGVLTGSKG
jgi:hypothetical protein